MNLTGENVARQHSISRTEVHVLRSIVRGVLGVLFAAAATWATNSIVDKLFGPENLDEA